MFTPEGYWSWDEVVTASVQWTHDLIIVKYCQSLIDQMESASSWETTRKINELLVEQGFVENIDQARFAIEVAHLWVLANFLDVYDAVLCSPAGVKMRCPPILKAHGDALDWWSWPLSRKPFGTSESSGYLNFFKNGNFRITDANDRFCAIDYLSGTVRLKPNSVRLFELSSYGHGCDYGEVTRFIDAQVRPVLGWAVCWNPVDIPETESEILKGLGFTDLDWDAIDYEQVEMGAKKTPHAIVLECVLEAFPNGKGDATWAIVEKAVGYSRRSVVRALKQNNLWSSWSEGGQNDES